MTRLTPMEQLKMNTCAAHDQLERNSFAASLMSGRLTKGEYRAFLAKFYGIYAPLEPALISNSHLAALDFDYSSRLKLPALESDLRSLHAEPQNLPICDELLSLNSLAQTLGVLYVIEGSTLGGKVLTRKLIETFGPEAENFTRFFNSYGERVGMLWKSFGEVVNTNVKPEEEAVLIDAASSMFLIFGRWLKN